MDRRRVLVCMRTYMYVCARVQVGMSRISLRMQFSSNRVAPPLGFAFVRGNGKARNHYGSCARRLMVEETSGLLVIISADDQMSLVNEF